MVVQGSQLALHFLICVTLFADLQMSAHIHTFSTLFFFRDNFERLSLKVCCKRWRRSKSVHHVLSCLRGVPIVNKHLVADEAIEDKVSALSVWTL